MTADVRLHPAMTRAGYARRLDEAAADLRLDDLAWLAVQAEKLSRRKAAADALARRRDEA